MVGWGTQWDGQCWSQNWHRRGVGAAGLGVSGGVGIPPVHEKVLDLTPFPELLNFLEI